MTKPPARDKTFALIVGVGQREEDHESLAITATDAKRFEQELTGRCPFLPKNCYTLINEQANCKNLFGKLDELAASTKENAAELVIIYFSGHGCLVGDNYYLICRDTKNTVIADTGIAGSTFVQKLRAIKTDKMLLLLDCCHAGAIATPIAIPFNAGDILDLPNRVIISASHAAQVSYISKPVSIFTFAVIEALAGTHFQEGDKNVTVFDLAMYVRERVYPLSGYRQQPQFTVLENSKTSNFVLTRYPNGEPTPAFDEAFSLLNENGKAVNIKSPVERDETYRNQFNWFNTVNVNGNGSVGIMGNGNTVTITTSSTGQEFMAFYEIIKLQSQQLADVTSMLRDKDNKELAVLADKMEKLAILEIVLMQGNTLLLIDRDDVKQAFFKMLNGEIKDIMILHGKPRTGLTYLSELVSEISHKYQSFRFYYININKIGKDNSGQLISAAHLAEVIASKVGMSFNMKEFKLSTFISMLRNELDKQADAGRKCLLYFDQFSIELANDVQYLMEELVQLVALENAKVFIILSGYEKMEGWDSTLKRKVSPICIESFFDQGKIHSFIKRLYQDPELSFRNFINEPTFIASAERFLPAHLFSNPDIPNVKPISDAVHSWYESLRKKIPI